MNVDLYRDLKSKIISLGHNSEIEWSENLKPCDNADAFWVEYAWVVLNSGMKNQIAHKIWHRLEPVVRSGNPAASAPFGHVLKCRAIDNGWKNKEILFAQYLAITDSGKIEWLSTLDHIGGITKYHLAKNLGHDCAKPDRHLVRIAKEEGVHELCFRLSKESGDRIATVDLVIWRAANLGII